MYTTEDLNLLGLVIEELSDDEHARLNEVLDNFQNKNQYVRKASNDYIDRKEGDHRKAKRIRFIKRVKAQLDNHGSTPPDSPKGLKWQYPGDVKSTKGAANKGKPMVAARSKAKTSKKTSDYLRVYGERGTSRGSSGRLERKQ